MNVIDMRLDQLKPYENNPRNNDEAVDYVANSIERFGFKVPLVVDKDGTIVTGHTRYKAARQLGLDTVPVIEGRQRLALRSCQGRGRRERGFRRFLRVLASIPKRAI